MVGIDNLAFFLVFVCLSFPSDQPCKMCNIMWGKMPESRGMILLSKRQHWLKSFDLLHCVWGLFWSLPGASPPALYQKPQLLQAVGQGVGQGWARDGPPLPLWPSCPLGGFGAGTLCLRGIQMLNSNSAVDCSGTAMVHRCFSLLSTLLIISFLPQPELGTLMHLLLPAQQTLIYEKLTFSPVTSGYRYFSKAPVKHSSPKSYFCQNK